MSGINTPTIYIKQDEKDRFEWVLCLSENIKNPSCRSPNSYKDLIKCRQSAMRFCRHLTGKIKLVECDEIIVMDLIGDRRKTKT